MGGSEPDTVVNLADEAREREAQYQQGLVDELYMPITEKGIAELRERDLSSVIGGQANADAYQAMAAANAASVETAMMEGGDMATSLSRQLGGDAITAARLNSSAEMAGLQGEQGRKDSMYLNYIKEGQGIAKDQMSSLNQLSQIGTSMEVNRIKNETLIDASKQKAMSTAAGAAYQKASNYSDKVQRNQSLYDAALKRDDGSLQKLGMTSRPSYFNSDGR